MTHSKNKYSLQAYNACIVDYSYIECLLKAGFTKWKINQKLDEIR